MKIKNILKTINDKLNSYIYKKKQEYKKRKEEKERIKQERIKFEEEERKREEEIFRKRIELEFLRRTDPGAFGEYLIYEELNSGYLNGYGKILQNIYIPYNGRTSEIDVLLIHEKGIFVFESKNYSGWIFGSANQINWTQSLNRQTKTKFYNPIKQNATHIKAISKYLGINEKIMKSIIVFSNQCELKKVPSNTEYYTITRLYNLIDIMIKELDSRENILSMQDIDSIETKLEPLTNVSEEKKIKHIQDVQYYQNNNQPNNKKYSNDEIIMGMLNNMRTK